MASSSTQGQEDVATPTRPAVRRRPFDDLAADPWRPDALPRDGDEACPRAARASRRCGHAAVPGSRRGRKHEPDRARRVRAPGRRAPERAPGPTDHGVLPRCADAPLRPNLPIVGCKLGFRSGTRAVTPTLVL